MEFGANSIGIKYNEPSTNHDDSNIKAKPVTISKKKQSM